MARLLKALPLFNSSLYLLKAISKPFSRISIFDWLTFSMITFCCKNNKKKRYNYNNIFFFISYFKDNYNSCSLSFLYAIFLQRKDMFFKLKYKNRLTKIAFMYKKWFLSLYNVNNLDL